MKMKTWKSMLFASGAALVLTTGSGLAQGTTQNHGAPGASQERGGAAQPHTAQSPSNATKSIGNADRADRSPEQQKGAQRNEQGANRSAEENRQGNPQNAQNKSNKSSEQNAQYGNNGNNEQNKNQAIRNSEQKQNGATTNSRAERQNREKNRGTAERPSNERNAATQQQHGNDTAAEQLKRNSRLQANASGVNVKLNDQQRNEIRTTVIDKSGAPRVDHVDFDVAVGTVVPRQHVHVVPVPETLVRIEPEWRGYLYFVYEDEVVIVNPRDMKIVAVLAV